MKENMNEGIVKFLDDFEKKELGKLSDEGSEEVNDVYGFECSNWTCKC